MGPGVWVTISFLFILFFFIHVVGFVWNLLCIVFLITGVIISSRSSDLRADLLRRQRLLDRLKFEIVYTDTQVISCRNFFYHCFFFSTLASTLVSVLFYVDLFINSEMREMRGLEGRNMHSCTQQMVDGMGWVNESNLSMMLLFHINC